jgi:phage terminase small subunit
LKRELDREPKPTPLAPDPPAFLVGRALEVWHELAPELERMGLLTAADAAPLAGYSVARGGLRGAPPGRSDNRRRSRL